MDFTAEFKLEAKGKCVSSILTQERNEGFTEFQNAFDKYGDTMGQVNWPTHESYLKGLSERYPEETFTLDVFGDSVDTIFKKYFKNGKMFVSQAVVTYESFEESELKHNPENTILEEIKERLKLSSPGPWRGGSRTYGSISIYDANDEPVYFIDSQGCLEIGKNDLNFISKSKEDISYLLERIAKLESQLKTNK